MQEELFANMCKTCQQVKKRKTIYRHLPPKKIEELKPWYLVHVDLIGPYSKSKRKQQPGGAVIHNYSSLSCMNMIDPTTGWFEIVEILKFELDEATSGNYSYIDKSSSRVRHMFNNTWICIYPCPPKVLFGKRIWV